ncbi:MAG TPA: hypothetical protein VFJ06_11515 [Halococcus sp.]|nr:hypothetical protein [Halococcus sp.]
MPENDREQVNIPLDADVKDQWEDFVDEHPDYRYVSHLVRAAVGKEIRGVSSDSGTSGVSDERLSDIESGIISLENTLSEVNERLSNIERAMEAPAEDILDLAGKIFEVLPEEKELTATTQSPLDPDEAPPVIEGGGNTYVQTGRVTDIAEYLEEQRYRVRQAIEHLQDDTHLIKSLVIEGETRYYKEV